MIKKRLILLLAGLFVANASMHANEAGNDKQIEINNASQDSLSGAFIYTPLYGSGITVVGNFFNIPVDEAITQEMPSSKLGKQRKLFVTSNNEIKDAQSFKNAFKNSDAIERDMHSLVIPIGRTSTGTGLKKTQVTVGGGGNNKLYLEKDAFAAELYRDARPDLKRLMSLINATTGQDVMAEEASALNEASIFEDQAVLAR